MCNTQNQRTRCVATPLRSRFTFAPFAVDTRTCTDDLRAQVHRTSLSDAHASWFVGEEIVQDGRLLLGTPIDPLFLVLPRLDAARGECNGEYRGARACVDARS